MGWAPGRISNIAAALRRSSPGRIAGLTGGWPGAGNRCEPDRGTGGRTRAALCHALRDAATHRDDRPGRPAPRLGGWRPAGGLGGCGPRGAGSSSDCVFLRAAGARWRRESLVISAGCWSALRLTPPGKWRSASQCSPSHGRCPPRVGASGSEARPRRCGRGRAAPHGGPGQTATQLGLAGQGAGYVLF